MTESLVLTALIQAATTIACVWLVAATISTCAGQICRTLHEINKTKERK